MKLDLMPNVSNETRDKYTIGFIMKLRAVGRIALATSASGHKPHDWEDTFRKELTRLFDWLHLKGHMIKVTEVKALKSTWAKTPQVHAVNLTDDFFALLLKTNAAVRRHRDLVVDTFEDWKCGHMGPIWKFK